MGVRGFNVMALSTLGTLPLRFPCKEAFGYQLFHIPVLLALGAVPWKIMSDDRMMEAAYSACVLR